MKILVDGINDIKPCKSEVFESPLLWKFVISAGSQLEEWILSLIVIGEARVALSSICVLWSKSRMYFCRERNTPPGFIYTLRK